LDGVCPRSSRQDCKAEYYISYGKACQEAMFINQLLNELFKRDTSVVVSGAN